MDEQKLSTMVDKVISVEERNELRRKFDPPGVLSDANLLRVAAGLGARNRWENNKGMEALARYNEGRRKKKEDNAK